ncbi:hypothetical protein [Streptomyces sp. AC627_RSS907]|uniref:hypothetical protein n=1 Tax=Streptomyces sp. AC627_RSS907 TaxID=2823684 RepID=UPI001C229170|nr:hypothetical protein [Streptomyces sp. AC627_RSS907]
MAKNKSNRDRKQPRTERAQQTGESPVMSREEQHAPQMTPGDIASRKRQKRFGHN